MTFNLSFVVGFMLLQGIFILHQEWISTPDCMLSDKLDSNIKKNVMEYLNVTFPILQNFEKTI